jgi:hypothetical protein
MPDSGWAVVANEQRYPMIIGYSSKSHFDTNLEHQPGALRWLLQHHMNMIDSLRDSPSTFYNRVANPSPLTHALRDSQRGLIDTVLLKRNGEANIWKQRENNDEEEDPICTKVYNKFCPPFYNVSCGRTKVGCTAVALAQLAWYWKWPDYAMISDSIDVAGVWYGSQHRHYYDWDNMPASINNATPLYQVDMVAGLLRDCGYAAHMLYAPSYSLAGPVNLQNALENTYHFHVHREFEYAWTDMYPILQYELIQKRIVLCEASEQSTGEGHTFVLDGYSPITHKFHVNWGGGWVDNNMWDLGLDGFSVARTFFTELYPDCTTREASINGIEESTIPANKDITLYSANNVSLSQLFVASGAHLNISTGGIIYLGNGFNAQKGSFVKIAPNYTCSSNGNLAPVSIPDRGNLTEPAEESTVIAVFPNPAQNEVHINCSFTITEISFINIEGQVVLRTTQNPVDISALPQGLYIICATAEDGAILKTKIIHN